MTFARIRRVGRVFAVLLLAWTAADLCDYGLCPHNREPIAPVAPASPETPLTVGPAPVGTPAEAQPPVPPDDCFCCSHYVDVRVPYQVTLSYSVAWTVPTESARRSDAAPSEPYHPPLDNTL